MAVQLQMVRKKHSHALFENFSSASVEQVPTTTEVMTEPTIIEPTSKPVTMEPTVSKGPVTEGTTDIGGVATVQQIVVKDYQVLEIALPIALLTLLVIIVTVVVGVLVCVSRGRKHVAHKYEIPQATPTNPATGILDNSDLYYSSTEK